MKMVYGGEIIRPDVKPVLIAFDSPGEVREYALRLLDTLDRNPEFQWELMVPSDWTKEQMREVMDEYKRRMVAHTMACSVSDVLICYRCHIPITPPYPDVCPKCGQGYHARESDREFIERLIDMAIEVGGDVYELRGFIQETANHLGVGIEIPDLWEAQEQRARKEIEQGEDSDGED